MLYTDDEQQRAVRLLQYLAQAIAVSGRAIGYGMTLGNGTPPRSVFAGSDHCGFVFLVPPFKEDFSIKDVLVIAGESVQLLWVVPITNAERSLIIRKGVGEFCNLCDDHNASYVLSPRRSCFVGRLTD